jgi:hypothetical protein
MTLKTSNTVLWAVTGLLAVALVVVTALMMRQVGTLKRLPPDVPKTPSREVSETDKRCTPAHPSLADASPAPGPALFVRHSPLEGC